MAKTVIVGAGQAGHFCALSLRKNLPDEEIVMVGDEAEMPYDRPDITKRKLFAEGSPKYLLNKDSYASLGIDMLTGKTATAIDYEKKIIAFEQGEPIGYDKLLLATGSRNRKLNVPGGQHVNYLRTWQERKDLERRLQGAKKVALIGGGILNLELAALLRQASIEVIVIETCTMLLERMVPADFAIWLENRHRQEGVAFRYDTTLVSVEERGQRLGAMLSDGTEEIVDAIVAAIGVTPCIELAVPALKTNRGIIVDETGATGIENVYAAGEVAEYWHPALQRHVVSETWGHAIAHGSHVANSLSGSPSAFISVDRWWSEQYDLYIQGVGLFDRKNLLLEEPQFLADNLSRTYLGNNSHDGYGIFVNSQRDAAGYFRQLKGKLDAVTA